MQSLLSLNPVHPLLALRTEAHPGIPRWESSRPIPSQGGFWLPIILPHLALVLLRWRGPTVQMIPSGGEGLGVNARRTPLRWVLKEK